MNESGWLIDYGIVEIIIKGEIGEWCSEIFKGDFRYIPLGYYDNYSFTLLNKNKSFWTNSVFTFASENPRKDYDEYMR